MPDLKQKNEAIPDVRYVVSRWLAALALVVGLAGCQQPDTITVIIRNAAGDIVWVASGRKFVRTESEVRLSLHDSGRHQLQPGEVVEVWRAGEARPLSEPDGKAQDE